MTSGKAEVVAPPRCRPVSITGLDVMTACGRGVQPLASAAFAGEPAFSSVSRFATDGRRAGHAAERKDAGSLFDELARVTQNACEAAGLTAGARAEVPLLLAMSTDPAVAWPPGTARADHGAGATAAELARRCGLAEATRAYTTACVAASTAVIDAAVMIGTGRAERVLVAAGYLVDPNRFALFDAGRALALDGRQRPFDAGRGGMLLGDAAVAVLLESEAAAARRGAQVLARLTGWGRSGDAYHVTQPRPDGAGQARAITTALRRAGRTPADLGYVNAHGTGTPASDRAESVGLRRALGVHADVVPVSSSKSVHGHTLEASALVELVVTTETIRQGRLPVNAGLLTPADGCPGGLVDRPRSREVTSALTVNFAFGGANTALLVEAA
ncbi:beta-ketoacyl synthase N-terminal-like domain-containing protein [Micromonospora sp. NPDC005215]|uniref:beta-ketoacyl-[acyl-carrier-protein] synthase family protein n=1 Tax=Micromonospora sp. NPDC005215 TaxID=3157024 RepID=UPI0033A0BE37